MSDTTTFPRLLTAKNIAEILCVPVSTVHHWASRGEGPPSFKVGKHRRFDASAVLRWIDQTQGSAS